MWNYVLKDFIKTSNYFMESLWNVHSKKMPFQLQPKSLFQT